MGIEYDREIKQLGAIAIFLLSFSIPVCFLSGGHADVFGRRSRMNPEKVVEGYCKAVLGKKDITGFVRMLGPGCEEGPQPWGDRLDSEGFLCREWVGDYYYYASGYHISSTVIEGMKATVTVVFDILGEGQGFYEHHYKPHHRVVNYQLARSKRGWWIYDPNFTPEMIRFKIETLEELAKQGGEPGRTREDFLLLVNNLKKWKWKESADIPVVIEKVESFPPCWIDPSKDYCTEWVRKRGPLANEPP